MAPIEEAIDANHQLLIQPLHLFIINLWQNQRLRVIAHLALRLVAGLFLASANCFLVANRGEQSGNRARAEREQSGKRARTEREQHVNSTRAELEQSENSEN